MEGLQRVRKARAWAKRKIEHVVEKTMKTLGKSQSDGEKDKAMS